MSIQLARRLLYIPVLHLDANLINARQKILAVNQLEKWFHDEVILINMSATAHHEVRVDGNLLRTKKANQHIYTATATAKPSDPLYVEVEAALFPNGAQDENQQNDVMIVCEAAKYQAILVTNDGGSRKQPGGILGNRHKLKGRVRIHSSEEAVTFIRQKIRERDELNAEIVAQYGGQLPPWTGQD